MTKRIAVLTSGGDAPGMNAAIRSVTRAAIYHKLEVIGVRRGYEGLIDNDLFEMTSRDVSNIIQRGGTILKSARSQRFRTTVGRAQAARNIANKAIDALVVIGGDGTFTGAQVFASEHKVPVVGLPGTIDNDLYGTDFTIGYDTAINTAVEAIDKIRDTADSHDRLFFVEVMGRDAGFIAIRSGIAGGAEVILVPEVNMSIDTLVNKLEDNYSRQKLSSIVVVAEGEQSGGAFEIAKQVKERVPNYENRVIILGHIQRGGNPTTMDRVLASRLGIAAVDAILAGRTGIMLGVRDKEICHVPLEQAIKHHQSMSAELMRVAEILAT